jgi:hypothetical protein
MYRRTPGFLSAVTMTVQDGTTWEFEEKMKLPHYVQIACEFTYIGKPEAFTNGYLFDLGWARKGKLPENNPEFDKSWKMRTKEERKADRLNRSRTQKKFNKRWKSQGGKIEDSSKSEYQEALSNWREMQ